MNLVHAIDTAANTVPAATILVLLVGALAVLLPLAATRRVRLRHPFKLLYALILIAGFKLHWYWYVGAVIAYAIELFRVDFVTEATRAEVAAPEQLRRRHP